MLQSNHISFFSGVVVRGTEIALQKRDANFFADKGNRNIVGHSKPPYHTTVSGFVSTDDAPVMGSMPEYRNTCKF